MHRIIHECAYIRGAAAGLAFLLLVQVIGRALLALAGC